MKKSLLVLSVLGAAVAAHAQSSVTLGGTVDVGYSQGNGSLTDRSQLISGGNATSKLIFRGREDLGGGMSANFWLESGFLADSGVFQTTNTTNTAAGAGPAAAGGQGLTFNRKSDLWLAAPWGEIHAGRLWAPSYEAVAGKYDPFALAVGLSVAYGNSLLSTAGLIRLSNDVAYWTPTFGGFAAQIHYTVGENPKNGAATEDDGRGQALRLSYDAGAINAILAFQRHDFAVGDIKTTNAGFAYNFGPARVSLNYVGAEQAALKQRGYMVGGWVPFGVGEFKASYSTFKTNAAGSPSVKKLAVGYVHNMSKRTALYGTYARVRNSGGAAFALNGSTTGVNASSSGFDIGVRHNF